MSQDFSSLKSTGLRDRLARAFRKKPSRTRLTKNPPRQYMPKTTEQESPPGKSLLELHREKYKNSNIDTQLGERKDVTELLHGLTHRESFDSFDGEQQWRLEHRKAGDLMIASLSSELWEIIAGFLGPSDAANLVLSSKKLRELLGISYWKLLDLPENRHEKINFLNSMDSHLPHHLLCFPCVQYHLRIFPGEEKLKPPHVLNPVFVCPNAKSCVVRPPRIRLTPMRNLPYTFLQLALRAQKFAPEYGVSLDSLCRRWKEEVWSHQTRYAIHKGHLLLRVVSSCLATPGMAPSTQRLLLYSREDYTPYFSVCSHWKDGDLMKLCKCALNHIPKPPAMSGPSGRLNPKPYNPNAPITLCEECRPIRRCPQCPTEYLIEVRLVPDNNLGTFQRAIVLTRWSDLGSEMSPYAGEWAACNGDDNDYDSFRIAASSKRAISGTFESCYTEEQIPGQKILSLNPKGIRRVDEEGGGWW